MSIKEVRSGLKDYAKDIKLNLGAVLSEEGAPGLSQDQIYGVALSCVYATRNRELIEAVTEDATKVLSEEAVNAAKAAASIMAMNNIYYRFTHLVKDNEYAKMPANLRMNIIGRPGIDTIDFELYSLAVSAINGCGMCMDSHANKIVKAGFGRVGIQSAVRIAATINATAQAMFIN